MTIDPAQWPVAGAVIEAGRSLTIFPREFSGTMLGPQPDYCSLTASLFAENNAAVVAINFGGLAGAIKVRNGGFLAFVNISLLGPAYTPWTASNDTYLVDAAFASLPSIETEPNATVSTMCITYDSSAMQILCLSSWLTLLLAVSCSLHSVTRISSSTQDTAQTTAQPLPQGCSAGCSSSPMWHQT